MQEETENKISQLFKDAEDQALVHFNYEIKTQMRAIKAQMKYDSIHLLSGMGTTTLTVMNKCVEYRETKNEFPHKVFKNLNEFIQLMADTYNIYPNDVLV